MKLFIFFIALLITSNVQTMDSPKRGGKEEKEKKLTDSAKRRSSKNLSLQNSPAREGSPNSSVIVRSTSQSPQGSTVETRIGSAAHIQRTLIAFAQDGTQEEELTVKLDAAKKLKDTNRYEYDNQLRVILEIKMIVASAAKHRAAQELFESARAQVKTACDNVEEYQRNRNNAEIKTALLDVLKARELAVLAVGKRLCADHPHKFDAWCRYETDIDEGLMMLNETIRQFFAKHKITEEMKTKDISFSSAKP